MASREDEIYHVMDELEAIWLKNPSQRFLQLLFNLLYANYKLTDLGEGKLYNLVDAELLESLKRNRLW